MGREDVPLGVGALWPRRFVTAIRVACRVSSVSVLVARNVFSY